MLAVDLALLHSVRIVGTSTIGVPWHLSVLSGQRNVARCLLIRAKKTHWPGQ